MNKTITSNIAGYVFHIDENAYDKLDSYLKTIRHYFTNSQGKDEIITDIEARLAEMLHERIGDLKQVVTLEDVNQVIAIMGQPEAFIDDESDTDWQQAQSKEATNALRRLFRDPDDKVIGGVCAGVSNYLGLSDPIWLRLALVVSFFVFGSGLLLYIILMIIIPEAKTTAEKLQMRGESVNVSNIEKRVNEELEVVKNKWNHLHNNSGIGRKIGDFLHRAVTLAGSLIILIIKFIGKFIGVVFIIWALVGLLSLVSTSMGLPTFISIGNDGALSSLDVQNILHNLVGGSGMLTWMMVAAFLVLGIPLLALAFLGIKLLFNVRKSAKALGLSFLGLWIIGVFMAFTIGTLIATDFSSQGSKTETIELPFTTDPNQVINLALNHELGEDEPNQSVQVFNLNLLTPSNSTQLYGKPQLDIKMATSGGPKLLIKRSARAKLKSDALQRANKIDYGFVVNDTALLLNGYFEVPEDELWRTQQVELVLQLPVGYTIFLSDEMTQIIYDIENTTNTYDGDMVGRRWIMTPTGLACVDCKGITTHLDEDEDVDVELNVNDVNIRIQNKRKKQELKAEKDRLQKEMKEQKRKLKEIEEELEEEINSEEASTQPREILLRRVVVASYYTPALPTSVIQRAYPG